MGAPSWASRRHHVIAEGRPSPPLGRAQKPGGQVCRVHALALAGRPCELLCRGSHQAMHPCTRPLPKGASRPPGTCPRNSEVGSQRTSVRPPTQPSLERLTRNQKATTGPNSDAPRERVNGVLPKGQHADEGLRGEGENIGGNVLDEWTGRRSNRHRGLREEGGAATIDCFYSSREPWDPTEAAAAPRSERMMAV